MALALLPSRFPAVVSARLATRSPPPPSAPPSLPQQNHGLPPPSLSSSAATSTSSSSLQCQHFQLCSGCTREWDLDRPHVLEDAGRFVKDLGVSDFTFDGGRLWEWRCRAKLAVRGTPENPLIGLYQEGTHDVVDIPHCRGLSSAAGAEDVDPSSQGKAEA